MHYLGILNVKLILKYYFNELYFSVQNILELSNISYCFPKKALLKYDSSIELSGSKVKKWSNFNFMIFYF